MGNLRGERLAALFKEQDSSMLQERLKLLA